MFRATGPEMSVPRKLPATALPSVPCPVIQTPANRLPLSTFRSAASFTPSPLVPIEVVAGTPVDLDSCVIRLGLRAGRIGPQEIAVDPVAGRAGARDVNAGALAEAVDVQAADGDVRAGDRQAVAAAGLAAAQLDQRCAAIARLREAVDQHWVRDRGQGRERERSSARPGPGCRSRSCSSRRWRRWNRGSPGGASRGRCRRCCSPRRLTAASGLPSHSSAGPEPEDRPAEHGGRCGPSRATARRVAVPNGAMSDDHGSCSGGSLAGHSARSNP